MYSAAWRLRDGQLDCCLYRVQVEKVHHKTEIALFKFMKDWTKSADNWNPDDTKSYIFQKCFKSEKEFQKWFDSYPWALEEISSTSDAIKQRNKLAKQSLKSKKTAPKNGKKTQKTHKTKQVRKCTKCGKPGHYAKTCNS